MGLTSMLYRAARLSADARAVRKGKVPQRLVRKGVGRAIAKTGIFRWPS